MPMNDVATTQQVLKAKAEKVSDGVHSVSAPTQAEFNALVDAFNALLAEHRKVNIDIRL